MASTSSLIRKDLIKRDDTPALLMFPSFVLGVTPRVGTDLRGSLECRGTKERGH
jgi:hypothetical protein